MDGDLDVVLVGHLQAGVDDGERGAPVFVKLQTAGAGLDLVLERLGHAAVALAEDAHVDGQAFECLEHPHDVPGPGVQVVAHVPVAEPVPPPISVVMPEAMATSICCGQMKWMWVSMPPAVQILPSPAMISVPGPITSRGSTPDWVSGLPALPTATIRPARMPMSPLTIPQ